MTHCDMFVWSDALLDNKHINLSHLYYNSVIRYLPCHHPISEHYQVIRNVTNSKPHKKSPPVLCEVRHIATLQSPQTPLKYTAYKYNLFTCKSNFLLTCMATIFLWLSVFIWASIFRRWRGRRIQIIGGCKWNTFMFISCEGVTMENGKHRCTASAIACFVPYITMFLTMDK